MNGLVRTVLGDVPSAALGVTLAHEHLHMDASPLLAAHGYERGPAAAFDAGECRWNPGAHPDNYRFVDADAVLDDLADFGALGGRAVVDATPLDLGRDPETLRLLSRRSGIHVVMGTGYYLEATHRAHLDPGEEERQTYERVLADCAGDGPRPGIVGEIGTSDPPTPSELRVVRGAARAAAEAGLAVCVHVHPWGDGGPAVVDAALAAGLAPGRLVLLHMTTAIGRPETLDSLLARGVWLSFDLFGFDHSLLGPGRYPPSDADTAAAVARLVSLGHGDRVLVSQDIGVRTRLRRHGGWGYGHLLRHVVPLLRSAGLTEQDLRQLLTRNPASVLTLARS